MHIADHHGIMAEQVHRARIGAILLSPIPTKQEEGRWSPPDRLQEEVHPGPTYFRFIEVQNHSPGPHPMED